MFDPDVEMVIRGAAQMLLMGEHQQKNYRMHKNFREDMCRIILDKASHVQLLRVTQRVKMFAIIDGNRGMGDVDLVQACERIMNE